MSLINCPECSREVSDKAESCVHCGYPVQIKNTNSEVKADNYSIRLDNLSDRNTYVAMQVLNVEFKAESKTK